MCIDFWHIPGSLDLAARRVVHEIYSGPHLPSDPQTNRNVELTRDFSSNRNT
jgi:hypothetical protein